MSKKSLPRGWTKERLTEVAEINPTNPEVPPDDDTLVSFVPMGAVQTMGRGIDTSETRLWREVRKGYKRFQDGDVLFAKITPCMENGKLAVANDLHNGVGAGSTEFHVLRPSAAIRSDLLAYYLLRDDFRASARAKMKGTAGQLRVPQQFLEAQTLPVPPVADQKRIVETIDSYFTRLDAATSILERVQRNLKRYRASILKAAVEGRLVPTEAALARAEGRDYEPASVLLERVLAKRRRRWEEAELEKMTAVGKTPKSDRWKAKYKEPAAPDIATLPPLPEGWCWASVEMLGDADDQPVLTGPFGTTLGKADFVMAGTPVVTVGCLGSSGIDMQKSLQVTRKKASQLRRYSLRSGDVLFSRMAAVGRAGLVGRKLDGALFNYHIMRLRLDRRAISPAFFVMYVRGSGVVQDYVTTVNHGATRDGINTAQLLGMPVPLPPRCEQDRITPKVDALLSVEQAMFKILRANLVRSKRLRQTILMRALEGDLVGRSYCE